MTRLAEAIALASTPDTPDRLWTADDVASYLGLRVGWVYREVREDRIPHIKLGPRRVRFRKEAIDEWLLEHERGTPLASARRHQRGQTP
jgi:excisionase family DNA binding protein